MVEGHDFGLPEFDQLLQLHWIDVCLFFLLGGGETWQNVKAVFDAAIKVVLQPPKQTKKKKKKKQKNCTILWILVLF